jgi:hypothetical protein
MGRPHAGLGHEPHEFRNPKRADIESEFTLRGLELPYEMVVDQFEAVTRFISDAMEMK